jgi:antitoxin component of MazEF toxin-antitoxin module
MTREKIISNENGAAIVLSADVLEQMGIAIGDEIEIEVIDRTLILRPLDEVEREQTVASLTRSLLERRSRVYHVLGEGQK